MILFSLGTHSQDFSRMAKAADDYAAITDEKVIVQTGYTKYDDKSSLISSSLTAFCSAFVPQNSKTMQRNKMR